MSLDQEMDFDREVVKDTLKKHVATITFEKLDGTLREMRCTLIESQLPPPKELKEGEEKKVKKVNEEVLAVFDLDKQEWRSFRVDSIKSISVG